MAESIGYKNLLPLSFPANKPKAVQFIVAFKVYDLSFHPQTLCNAKMPVLVFLFAFRGTHGCCPTTEYSH